jgi:predicted Zn-dependent protease
MSRFVLRFVLAAALCAACATSPTGRSQLLLFPQAEMETMGATAYAEMKSTQRISTDATLQSRARCVADAVAAQVTGPYAGMQWEVTVPGQQQLLGLLGAGTIVLPFGRAQESESDEIGLELMAKAGFDPAQSVMLWRNMAAAGGDQPPEFLSTHPAHGRRIADLQAALPGANQLRAAARARGLRPRCY